MLHKRTGQPHDTFFAQSVVYDHCQESLQQVNKLREGVNFIRWSVLAHRPSHPNRENADCSPLTMQGERIDHSRQYLSV